MPDRTMITSRTSLVGLIAWPIGHSLSPAMHNAAFAELKLDWAYLPLPVQADSLQAALKGLAALGFKGCNISVPHKVSAMQWLDEVSPVCQAMGATNTISVRDGKLYGTNTDPDGFIRALQETGCELNNLRVLVIGAGGAARAAVYGLSRFEGTSITVVDVINEQAERLVHDLSGCFSGDRLSFAPYTNEVFSELRTQVDLLVNASPVGMSPNVNQSPWPEGVPFPHSSHIICFDMVYNPLETLFLQQAKAAGLKTASGLSMLVHQGASSFEIWTGMQAPRETMRNTCLQYLGRG